MISGGFMAAKTGAAAPMARTRASARCFIGGYASFHLPVRHARCLIEARPKLVEGRGLRQVTPVSFRFRRNQSPSTHAVFMIRGSAHKPMKKKDAFMLRAPLWEDKQSPHDHAPFHVSFSGT